MSLLAEAQEAQTSKGPRCSVAAIKAQHPDMAGDIDELLDAVRSRSIFGNTAARVLQNHGIKVQGETLMRHVGGRCSCR